MPNGEGGGCGGAEDLWGYEVCVGPGHTLPPRQAVCGGARKISLITSGKQLKHEWSGWHAKPRHLGGHVRLHAEGRTPSEERIKLHRSRG